LIEHWKVTKTRLVLSTNDFSQWSLKLSSIDGFEFPDEPRDGPKTVVFFFGGHKRVFAIRREQWQKFYEELS